MMAACWRAPTPRSLWRREIERGIMRADSFAALRYRDFRLLWFGQLVSQSGTQMQRVAIAWHVYLLTHDPIALGLIGVFRVLPVLVFSLAGGVVADAQDRRRVLLFT